MSLHKGKSVILYGGGYNWDDSLEYLSASGISTIIRLDDAEIPGRPGPTEDMMKFISDLCQNTADIKSCAVFDKTDLSRIIFPKLAHFIADSCTIRYLHTRLPVSSSGIATSRPFSFQPGILQKVAT